MSDFECPRNMADGRIFTDYRPTNYSLNLIKMSHGLHNSNDVRKYLTENAKSIMDEQRNYYVSETGGCTVHQCNAKVINIEPHLYMAENTVSRNSLPPANGGDTIVGYNS